MKTNFPKTTKSTNAHDWGYKWGCHYYQESAKVVTDFQRYLKIHLNHAEKQAGLYCQNIHQIWKAVDPNKGIFPQNYLPNTDLIEDNVHFPVKTV